MLYLNPYWGLNNIELKNLSIFQFKMSNQGLSSFIKYQEHIYKRNGINQSPFNRRHKILEQWNSLSDEDKFIFSLYPEGDIPFDDETPIDTILRWSPNYYKHDPDFKEFVCKELIKDDDTLFSTPRYNAYFLADRYRKHIQKMTGIK